jgi:UDP-glucose 4-epimerase
VATTSFELSRQTVLVTGARGFIGSHLSRALTRCGAKVHGVSRRECLTDDKTVRWWELDLANSAAVRQLMRDVRPDVVFHLASHVAGAREIGLVIPTFQSNLASTVNLLTYAAETGCKRFLLAGSLEEPDPNAPDAVPCSPYAAAKSAGTHYARMFHQLWGLPTVIAKLFMVYGPEQKDERKLIPYVSVCLLRGEAPKISSGQRMVDWIYVDDVVEGLLAAAVARDAEGTTVDIGSGRLVSIREVVKRMTGIVNPEIQPLFGAVADRPLEQVRVAEIAKSKALLGWEPKTSLQEGLERTVCWHREQLHVTTSDTSRNHD